MLESINGEIALFGFVGLFMLGRIMTRLSEIRDGLKKLQETAQHQPTRSI
jgi:hypothetical protein